MKAVTYCEYGGPEVLQLTEVEKPVPDGDSLSANWRVLKPNGRYLVLLAELMQQGRVRSVIDKTYMMSEAGEAMRHLETGRARGKIVIQVG